MEYELGSRRSHSELVVLTLENETSSGLLITHNNANHNNNINNNMNNNGMFELNVKTSTSSNASSSANSIISSNIQLQAAMLSNSTSFASLISNPSPISPGVDNVWKKRNLENSVSIPQATQIKSRS